MLPGLFCRYRFNDVLHDPSFFSAEGFGFYDRNPISRVAAIFGIVSFIFLSTPHVLFIDWMLDKLLHKNDDSFVHLVANNDTLSDFSYARHVRYSPVPCLPRS